MKDKKIRTLRVKHWSHRTKRGVFLLGLLLAFGLAGLFVMSA
jgi:hypothetical protein